jgi:hypothetical protein
MPSPQAWRARTSCLSQDPSKDRRETPEARVFAIAGSRVETKMQCVKLLGRRRMARDFDHQPRELQAPIAVLKGCTALGMPFTRAVGWVRLGNGEPSAIIRFVQQDLCKGPCGTRRHGHGSPSPSFHAIRN